MCSSGLRGECGLRGVEVSTESGWVLHNRTLVNTRDGANNVIWLIELEESISSLDVVDIKGPSLPARPQVKLPYDDTDSSAAGQR